MLKPLLASHKPDTGLIKTETDSPVTTPLKVLLVEDDPLDAELNIVNLEAEGFKCDWQRVQTEKGLVAALKNDKFDILLVDYNLPGFDGLRALNIAADFALDIPVIFVTGNLKTELAIESIKAGAVDFVHKDRLARLGSSVRRALEEFALRRADRRKKAELDIFRMLNEVANEGAPLDVLANTLADVLPTALESNDVAVYLRSHEQNSLIVYNITQNAERLKHIEKILGISVPAIVVPLDTESVYADVINEKQIRVLDTPEDILQFYTLYLDIAHFPPAIYKRVKALLPTVVNFIGLEKVVLFPFVTGEKAIGLLEISYKDRKAGLYDVEYLGAMLGQITAIFARKRLEEEVSNLNDRQKMILDSAAEGIMGMDMEGHHIFVNPAAAKMLGYEVAELLNEHDHAAYHPPTAKHGGYEANICSIYNPDASGAFAEQEHETVFLRKDGTQFPVSYVSSKIIKEGETLGVVIAFRDITEQVENTRELARLAQVINQVQTSVGITDLSGNLLYVNPFFEKVSGYSKAEMLGKKPNILKSGYQGDEVYKELWQTIAAGDSWHGKLINRDKQNNLYHEDAIIFPIKTDQGETINYATVKREISAEVEAQELIKRQLSHLESLHLVDATILTSMDLPLTLDVVLGEAMKELQLDAVDVLVYNPMTQSFSCISRLGFTTQALEFTHLRLGEGLAGQAALRRELVYVDNLSDMQDGAPQLESEKFVSYYGVPLEARGELKGVMEIFFRAAFTPDAEWFSFLNSIAGQAAIAIENHQLFSGLREKNAELSLAYEATLEGWVRGLELHDMETEGHSRRVVDMTLRLARRMGIREDLLVHIRRGALLHDIGKLAIPSHILNKRGPFTPEEKALMQKHTIYGYEMLADIPFLKPALEIPYSHHEKWDGSGYPLGMRGASIPMTARIFAIIDVYDALIYDRPYRKAWDQETVLDYLKSESGIHFDPSVVDAFFEEFVFSESEA